MECNSKTSVSGLQPRNMLAKSWREAKMYSPKIAEDLIPKIYRVAKAKGIRQTVLVNSILEQEIDVLHDQIVGQSYEKHRSEKDGEPIKRKRVDIEAMKTRKLNKPKALANERSKPATARKSNGHPEMDATNLQMLTALALDMNVKPGYLLNSLLQESLD